MKISYFILFITVSLGSFGQETYQPVKSGGEIPADFTTLSSSKYEEGVKGIEYTNSEDLKDRKEFLLQSNFSIDEILQGGQVLFNEPISDYVNEVVDVIYEANIALPEELKFYITRSTATNAFSTNQGVIFITTGLIAQLENEAQLAFILCHEISHYVKKHTIQSFLESKNTIRNDKSLRTVDDYIALMSKYSKSQEFEADEKGLNYFINTDYDLNESITAFDVLHYSYLPFNEVPFDLNFLVQEDFIIRTELVMDSINKIDVFNEDYDDYKSSHPNIWKRKQKVKSFKANNPQPEGEWFIVGEDTFTEIQLLCRKEGIRIYLLQGDYADAIYSSYLIHLLYPEDEFPQLSSAKALYGLHQHDAFGEFNKVMTSAKKIEGESSRLYHFLNELDEEELAVLAAQNLFRITKKYPENDYYQRLLEDCIYDMVFEQELTIGVFNTQSYEETRMASHVVNDGSEADINNEEEGDEESEVKKERKRSGKYGKIEEAKVIEVYVDEIEEKEQVVLENTYTYGFVTMLKDSLFHDLFDSISLEYDEQEEQDNNMSSRERWRLKKAKADAKRKRNKRILREGTGLGLEDVAIYSPTVANYKKKGAYDYLESESDEIYFTHRLEEYSLQTNGDYNVISFNNQNEIDTEMYNYMSRLSAWSFESLRLEILEVEMIPSESEYISELKEYTGSRYLALTDITSSLEKRYVGAEVWYYSVFLFPTLPITIAMASTPKKHYIHGLKVYDLNTGLLIHRSYRDLQNKRSKRGVDAVAYDTIQQLSRTRKK